MVYDCLTFSSHLCHCMIIHLLPAPVQTCHLPFSFHCELKTELFNKAYY